MVLASRSREFRIKQNDTSPALVYQTNPVVNFTGASVVFNMRLSPDGAVKCSRKTAAVEDAAGGSLSYEWEAADTDTAGRYQAEFEVTFGDGSIETFPNFSYIPVVISDDIA